MDVPHDIKRHEADPRFLVVERADQFAIWQNKSWCKENSIEGIIMRTPLSEAQRSIAREFAAVTSGYGSHNHFLKWGDKTRTNLRSEYCEAVPADIESFLITAFNASIAALGDEVKSIDLRSDCAFPIKFHKHDDTVSASMDGAGTVIELPDGTTWTGNAGEIVLMGDTISHRAPDRQNFDTRTTAILGII